MSQQYRQPNNLQARINLHTLYKTNPYNWFNWVFDHFPPIPSARVLELGCGTGSLWQANLSRLPAGWSVFLSDFSMGMVKEAASQLAGCGKKFLFVQIDAQNLPFPDGYFDMVVANHMLYHVPDRERAFIEIHRVLTPGGRLLAATNGENHMQEIFTLGSKLVPTIRAQSERNFNPRSFSLENGLEQLREKFGQTTRYTYEDSLEVSQARPLVEYILSIIEPGDPNLTPDRIIKFTDYLNGRLARDGSIRINKITGLLEAIKTVS